MKLWAVLKIIWFATTGPIISLLLTTIVLMSLEQYLSHQKYHQKGQTSETLYLSSARSSALPSNLCRCWWSKTLWQQNNRILIWTIFMLPSEQLCQISAAAFFEGCIWRQAASLCSNKGCTESSVLCISHNLWLKDLRKHVGLQLSRKAVLIQ